MSNTKRTINRSLMRGSGDPNAHHPATITAPEEVDFEDTWIPTLTTAQRSRYRETLKVEIHVHLSPQSFQTRQEECIEQNIFVGRPDAIYTLGQCLWTGVTCGVVSFFYWYKSLPIKYHITTQRIIIEKGVLSKTQKILELIYVNDFWLEYPLKMRVLGEGYGILHIRSSKPDLSIIHLYGIKDIGGLYEQLRRAVIEEQKRRRVGWWKDS